MHRTFTSCCLMILLLLCLGIGRAHAADDPAERKAQGEAPDTTGPSTAGSPWAEVRESAHHLGKISKNRTYEYAFKVANMGTAVLEIRKVLPG